MLMRSMRTSGGGRYCSRRERFMEVGSFIRDGLGKGILGGLWWLLKLHLMVKSCWSAIPIFDLGLLVL